MEAVNIEERFRQISDERKDLFIDTGAVTGEDSQWYRETVAPAESIFSLDPDSLSKTIGCIELFARFFRKGAVRSYVTPKVLQEIITFNEILKHRVKKIMASDINLIYVPAMLNHKRGLLKEVQESYRRLASLAARNIFPVPDRAILNHLDSKVRSIALERKSKRKYLKNPIKTPGYCDKHTDEEVVASAIYHSVVDRRASNILATDRDLGNILNDAVGYFITSGNYAGFRDAFLKNPVCVYRFLDGRITQTGDSSAITLKH